MSGIEQMGPLARLDVSIRARYPVIFISSLEESRVLTAIRGMLDMPRHKDKSPKTLLIWSISRGLMEYKRGRAPERIDGTGAANPNTALGIVQNYGKTPSNPAGDGCVAVFLDLDATFNDPRVVRALRDCCADLPSTSRTVVILSSSLQIPPSLQREATSIEWPLPTAEELARFLDDFIAGVPAGVEVRLNGDREGVARALCGLTLFQAASVLSTTMATTKRIDESALSFIKAEKARLVKESGKIEITDPTGIPEVGGLDLLRAYLKRRRRAFGSAAAAFGLDTPRALLLLGVPGCGKSLACKALAREWGIPLLKLDMGAMMGSYVGESEKNLRAGLKVAESSAPCVLWLDEIEKGLSGSQSSGRSDGGTTSRVLGTLLTWLQEHTEPVYLIATSNDVSQLPAELLRAGRFDDIFFVDLPTAQERRAIWSVHLERRGREPGGFDLDLLAEKSAGYTGSEIEAGVIDALYAAFDDGERALTTADLLTAIQERVPLSRTMQEQIEDLREFGRSRAKAASFPEQAQQESGTRSRMVQV